MGVVGGCDDNGRWDGRRRKVCVRVGDGMVAVAAVVVVVGLGVDRARVEKPLFPARGLLVEVDTHTSCR